MHLTTGKDSETDLLDSPSPQFRQKLIICHSYAHDHWFRYQISLLAVADIGSCANSKHACKVSDTSLIRILFNYADNNNLALLGKGSGGLSGLIEHLKEDERIYGYFKVTWGDDEAKREKFIFLTWVGERVPPLKKARVSTDKAFVKQVVKVSNFSITNRATNDQMFVHVPIHQILPIYKVLFSNCTLLFQDFATEVFANKIDELDEGDIVKKVKIASGADYGSGDRQ